MEELSPHAKGDLSRNERYSMNVFHNLVYSNRPGIRLFRHILFWVVDLINYFIAVYQGGGKIPLSFIVLLFKFPFIIGSTYFILYNVLPLISRAGQRLRILTSIVGVLLVLGPGMRYYKLYFVAPLVDPGHQYIKEIGGVSLMSQEIFGSLMVMFMAIAIKMFKGKSELQRSNEQLAREKRQAELNFLKAQMHPHFLFNTLNTLYSETMQNSGKAQLVILHLSSLMRFILDECNKPSIPLSQEVKVIEDYIELEKLRHGDRLHVTFRTTDLSENIMISPLILLPFVENSFKHSIRSVRGDIHIEIQISLLNGRLFLSVTNDPVGDRSEHKPGKGIANIQRQLDLLYNKDYSLVLNGTASKYKVYLALPETMPKVA